MLVGWVAPLAGPVFLALCLQVWRIGVRHYRSTAASATPEPIWHGRCSDSSPEDIMPASNDLEHRTRGTTAHHHGHGWGWPMAIGILLIAGGVFALGATVLTSLVSVVYLGILLLIVGGLEIVSAFRVGRSGPFLVYFLAGLLAVVVGALFLYRPLVSLASLTLLIAGYLFASGLFRGITAIVDRYRRWGWDLAYAVVAVALGVIVVAEWPFSSFWVLGAVVAAEIIARGIALVAAAWVIRDLSHHHDIPGGFAAT